MLFWACAAAVAAVVLGLAVGDGPTAVDTWVARRIGPPSPFLDTLSLTTHPAATVAVIAATVVLARRHPRTALVAAAGPALAVALTTWVLKPAFGRVYDDHLAYPSGHTTALAAILTVLVLAAGPRWAAAAVALVLVAGVAIVGMRYHYPTDVLGAALWGPAVVTFLWGTLARRPRSGDTSKNAEA